jgi:hypothetical protein
VSVVAILLAFVTKAKNTLNSIAEDYEQLKSVVDVAHPTIAHRAVIECGHSCIAGSAKSGGFAMVTFERLPGWLYTFATLIGQDALPQITEVQLIAPGFDDDQLDALAEIKALRSIDFDRTKVTDAGLSKFCRKSSVKNIHVGNRNENITNTGRDVAAEKTQRQEYTRKWPPA